ncbi:hypothetical protein IC007_0982 [Sulfuracidifex tepidarius]|uniref:Uncharacterized protein n=1 Tax=Sulfuracidifex tepidarius TaxID=1294262 RepID=A0A510E1V6_9CREN|nr:hypothetical protein IC007_0982 [Sulfuracidifex tepidarius]
MFSRSYSKELGGVQRGIFIETVALIALPLIDIKEPLEKGAFKYKGAIHTCLRESRLSFFL